MVCVWLYSSVFLLQYLVSVPLKMFRPWAFMGMMAQVRHTEPSITFSLLCCMQNTLWPLTFNLSRFLWRGLWVVFLMETMATPQCGSHSSLASLSLCWCTSMTTMSFIMGARHSTHTHTVSVTHINMYKSCWILVHRHAHTYTTCRTTQGVKVE